MTLRSPHTLTEHHTQPGPGVGGTAPPPPDLPSEAGHHPSLPSSPSLDHPERNRPPFSLSRLSHRQKKEQGLRPGGAGFKTLAHELELVTRLDEPWSSVSERRHLCPLEEEVH